MNTLMCWKAELIFIQARENGRVSLNKTPYNMLPLQIDPCSNNTNYTFVCNQLWYIRKATKARSTFIWMKVEPVRNKRVREH